MTDYKQVVIIRTDLKMDKGKMVAQGGHAFVNSALLASPAIFKAWDNGGCKKVALKTDSLGELLKLFKAAQEDGLPCFLVRDAGCTQVEPGTVTCLGIGPASEKDIDALTRQLKLL